MRVPSVQTVVVKPEQIRLVRRDDSKKWQAHYKLGGIKTWFRRSTDTANVKEATRIAERMWMKATFDHVEGRPVISRRFKPVAEVVLARMEAEIGKLEEFLGQPNLFTEQPLKFNKATALLLERQEALAAAEAQWLELEEKAGG